MAESSVVRLVIKRKWWLSLYLAGLVTCAAITGSAPNWSRVDCWLRRALKIYLAHADGSLRRIA